MESFVTATTHNCEEVLDAHYMPVNDVNSQELFQQKQYFMYSVLSRYFKVIG